MRKGSDWEGADWEGSDWEGEIVDEDISLLVVAAPTKFSIQFWDRQCVRLAQMIVPPVKGS